MSQQSLFRPIRSVGLDLLRQFLPLEVLHSAAGYYIGTRDTEGPAFRGIS